MGLITPLCSRGTGYINNYACSTDETFPRENASDVEILKNVSSWLVVVKSIYHPPLSNRVKTHMIMHLFIIVT